MPINEETIAAARQQQLAAPYRPADAEAVSGLDYLVDIPRGIARGLVGVGESLTELADTGLDFFDAGFIDDNDLTWREDLFGENKTLAGGLVEGVTSFATAFIPVSGALDKINKLNKLRKSGLKGRIAFDTIAGVPSDFLAFNGHDGRLSDLIEQYPSLQNPITEFLSSEEDDHELEGRFKNAVEGALMGPVVDTLLSGLRFLKDLKKAESEGGVKAREDYLKKNLPKYADKLSKLENPLTLQDANKQLRDAGYSVEEISAWNSIIRATANNFDVDADTLVGLTFKDIRRGNAATDVTEDALKQTVALRDGDEFVEIPGTGSKGKVTLEDIQSKLHERAIGLLGRPLDLNNPKDLDKAVAELVNEVRFQINDSGLDSGAGWYKEDMKKAWSHIVEIEPRLANDDAAQGIFKTALALTSNGNKVGLNAEYALRAVRGWLDSGRKKFDATTKNGKIMGRRGHLIKQGFDGLQELVDRWGAARTAEWLNTEHTVKELREVKGSLKAYKTGSVSGKQTDMKMGSMIFGPKVGEFAQNVNGNTAGGTFDVWWTRTYKRITGTLDEAMGEKASPKNDSERKLMQSVLEKAAAKVGVEPADLQAIAWYYEQGLYRDLGSRNVSESFSHAYERIRSQETGAPLTPRGQDAAAGTAGDRGAGSGGVRSGDRGVSDPSSKLATRSTVNEEIVRLADEYSQSAGIQPVRLEDYVTVDESRARSIASAYESLEHRPNDPEVKAAYDALARETLEQYKFLRERGVEFEWTKEPQTYTSSTELFRELREGKPMRVFLTEGGFGSGDALDGLPHPLLASSGVVENGIDLTFNDLFRAVHDYFGHGKPGASFGPRGEENAWRAHSVMFSPEARRAMTTETRGQNSWVNFGPQSDANLRAIQEGRVDEDFVFADQKAGLLPESYAKLDEELGLRQTVDEQVKGQVSFADDARAVVDLFEGSDISTLMHETAHVFRKNLQRFDDKLAKQAEEAFGVKDGNWTRANEEDFARGFETYLKQGSAPSPQLRKVFDRFKAWLTSIYSRVTKSPLGDRVSPEIREFFDNMLGGRTKQTVNIRATTQIKERIAERVGAIARGEVSLDEGIEGIDLNLEKLDTDLEVKELYNVVSEEMAKQFDSLKGGKQSFDEIKERAFKTLAEDLDDPVDTLKARLQSRAKDANRLASDAFAARLVLKSHAEQIQRIGQSIELGNATKRDEVKMLQLIEEMVSLQGDLKAGVTAAARMTAQGRIRVDSSLTAQKLDEWISRAGGSKRVRDLAKHIKGTDGRPAAVTRVLKTRWDPTGRRIINVHNEIWLNAILSGPVTHTVNLISTLTHGVVRSAEKVVGGSLTANGEVVREGIDEIAGMFFNIKQSVAMMNKSLKMGDPILDPGNQTIDAPIGAVANRNSTKDLGELARRTREGESPKQLGLDYIGNLVRLPGRFLTAEDELNKQLFYRGHLFAKGLQEARRRGLGGRKEQVEYAVKYIDSGFDSGGRATDVDALFYAQEGTFTNDLVYGIGHGLQKFVNSHPSARLVLPFVRTPTNIFRQLWRHTPGLAAFQRQWMADFRSGDPSRKAMAVGQQVVGLTLLGGATMAASSGRITGGGPSDPKERALLRQTGWQPYSLVSTDENGKKKYTSYQRLDPWASAIGLVADYVELGNRVSDEDREDLAIGLMAAFAKNVTNKTYLRGLAEAVDVLTDPERNMEHWAQRQVGSYVPNFLNQTNPDDTLREVRSYMDAVKARTPGYSESLDPRRNMFGQPITFEGSLGPDLVSPFYQSTGLNSAAREELVNLGLGIGQPKEEVQPGLNLTQHRVSPNQTAYDRWLEMVGQVKLNDKNLEEYLNELVQDPRYQALPAQATLPDGIDSLRTKYVKRGIQRYRNAALMEFLKEQPEIAEMYKEAAVNAKRVQALGAAAGVQ